MEVGSIYRAMAVGSGLKILQIAWRSLGRVAIAIAEDADGMRQLHAELADDRLRARKAHEFVLASHPQLEATRAKSGTCRWQLCLV